MLDAAPPCRLDTRDPDPFHERNAAPCCGNWGVCYTHSQAERWAQDNLRRAGFRTYLPLITVTRRDPVVRSLRHHLELPLFPRYLFVEHDNPTLWRPIRETPGVAAVIQCGLRMQYVHAGAVEALQALEELRRSLPQDIVLRPGEACEAILGGGVKVRGIVTAIKRRSARVAIMMLGQLREITVDANKLRLWNEE